MSFSGRNGLLRGIRNKKLGSYSDAELSFVDYGEMGHISSNNQDRVDHGGAYLFMPKGPAQTVLGKTEELTFRIIRGPLVSQVHVLKNPLLLSRISVFRTLSQNIHRVLINSAKKNFNKILLNFQG